jgi:serine protease
VLLVSLASGEALARPELAPGQLILHSGARETALRALRDAALEARPLLAIGGGALAVTLVDRSEAATRRALAALERAGVKAEPGLIRRPFLVPSDPKYPLQWGFKAIRLEQAWDQTTGNAGVVIGFVDTGVLADHPDLEARLLPGRDFISDAKSAGDGDGWDADAKDEGSDLTTLFHGTQIAGILGAATNNGRGVAGVTWASRLLPVRALGVVNGIGTDGDIAAAVRWAAGGSVPDAPANPTPARVVVLGFGGPGQTQVLGDSVAAALARGAILVSAVGNLNTDASNIYPAAYPGVIAVGATGLDGKRAPYSNYGPTVTIMAPGGDLQQMLPFQFEGKTYPAGILSTLYQSDAKAWSYQLHEGTTLASAEVAGVVALMLARKPSLTADEVRSILIATANPTARCAEGCGAGLLDAAAALAMLDGTRFDGLIPLDLPRELGSNGDLGMYPRRGCSCSLDPLPGGESFLALVLAAIVLCGARRRATG